MNQELKKEWIDALRSGKYEQGKKVLHDRVENTFCCLGVLCEILADKGVVERIQGSFLTGYKFPIENSFCIVDLSKRIGYYSGISVFNHHRLVEMNDEECKTFEEIANYIECTL